MLAQSGKFNILRLELNKEGQYLQADGSICELTNQREIRFQNNTPNWKVDYAVPCIHGYPGETGDIQSYFELIKLPYFGCQSEASQNCFNKITTKLWLSALGIPNTDYIFLNQLDEAAIHQTQAAFQKWQSIFIKAATQGSSVGCYKVENAQDIPKILAQAFSYAPYVIVEKQ